MSGIYIPGMEMPTNENEAIDIRLFPDGNIAAWDKQKGWVHYIAIPVPDHGRCVDADVLYAVMKKEHDRISEDYGENDEYVQCLNKYAMSMVHSAPTIIPAQEAEG